MRNTSNKRLKKNKKHKRNKKDMINKRNTAANFDNWVQ